jgi:hypothetical protein
MENRFCSIMIYENLKKSLHHFITPGSTSEKCLMRHLQNQNR